ncbi:hypothetical protein LZ554_007177 [Drepanopeziza brunnea f. sp. 'monogermtubi']|nr:hypothetical protein LZ554_007177 [Drepanopeziza brunnea f. sp. 'monogermtubi']
MHIVVLPALVAALVLCTANANANANAITNPNTNANANPSSTTVTPKPTPTPTLSIAPTCEARTVNYITDVLPQQCLKSSWRSANGTARGTEGAGGGNGTQTIGGNAISSIAGQEVPQSTDAPGRTSSVEVADAAAAAAAADLETGELNEASFLSFEEWKKQTLEKAGQANANIGGKRNSEARKRDSESLQNNLDSLGEEGEIDLDFGAFRSGGREEAMNEGVQDQAQHNVVVEERKNEHYRSKDAGKTCKERFSYASFDAGATILKTHPGAKNSKAVLIENKDSYMLSECKAENKFIIIELSEDIWIDTVVLANYEFFSSMIRTFRVSLSDRYPVKIDKWKDAGTYEARNSREIQAFLIANPQIWARYIRIEFLSHYGNEYYCPLSLVRVHGTRMLESWKETEEVETGEEEQFVPDAVVEVVQTTEKQKAAGEEVAWPADPSLETTHDGAGNSSQETFVVITTTWEQSGAHIFRNSDLDDTCHTSESPVPEPAQTATVSATNSTSASTQPTIPGAIPVSLNATTATVPSIASQTPESGVAQNAISKPSSAASSSIAAKTTSDPPIPPPPSASTQKMTTNSTTPKNKTTTTSSAAASLPTIQESFFKAVSRRLNFLETNSTLSLKYIEEQSRILREAFTKVEKKQLQKTTTFLDTLNSTVLDELRQFRQQYDEIWQSTVISLESQRDESRREILAISSRLNILADEVVFQKRMSIVQSVLLLLCLALVIFSRVSAGTNIELPTLLHNRLRVSSPFPIESPLESPGEGEGNRRAWLDAGHRGRLEDEVPPTPFSAYSHEGEQPVTPRSAEGGEDVQNHIHGTGELLPSTEGYLDSAQSSQNHTPAQRAPPNTVHSTPQPHPQPQNQTTPDLTVSPKKRTHKKRRSSARRRNSTATLKDVDAPSPSSSPAQPSQSYPDPPIIEIHNSTPIRRQRSSSLLSRVDLDSYAELEPPPPSRPMPFHLPSPPPDVPPSQASEIQLASQENREPFTTSPPSPKPEHERERKDSSNITRKPLPALPSGA